MSGTVVRLRLKGFGGRSARTPGAADELTALDWRKLGTPKLPPQGRAYTKERGISDEVALLNNVRWLTTEEALRLWPRLRRCTGALLVPYAHHYGAARIFYQSKKDETNQGKFRSTTGKLSRLFKPKLPGSLFDCTDWKQLRKDTSADVVIAEGPFKTLAAISHGILAVGINGCWNWQAQRQPIVGLHAFKWRKRRVTPAFDADVQENLRVALPYLLLGDWLEAHGATVVYLRIPPIAGRKSGLDDFLAASKREGFDKLPRAPWDDCADLDALRVSVFRKTEGGLAALFVLRYLSDLYYDPEDECWYVWNGLHWQRQPQVAPDVQEAMKETVVSIITDATKIGDAKRRKIMEKWGVKCDELRVMRAATKLASSDPRLRISSIQMDAEPWLLGVRNGVVDLRAGALLPGTTRDQLVSRSVAAEFDPDAMCEEWERFVNQITCGDTKLAGFLQRLAGYCLIGGNPLRYIFFLHGEGRNGKTVFIETLLKLMGDYGHPIKAEALMQQKFEQSAEGATPFLRALQGMRYISASEVKDGMRLDAGTVKMWTGGDYFPTRGLHEAPVNMIIIGKILVRCNHRPIIDGADKAIWDRVIEIPFKLDLKEKDQDLELQHKLAQELPGILAWAVRGCSTFVAKKGLGIPESVRAQTRAYQRAMDSFTDWLDERTSRAVGAKVESMPLYNSYTLHCTHMSSPIHVVIPMSQKEFTKRLRKFGLEKKESNGKVYWHGIKLGREK